MRVRTERYLENIENYTNIRSKIDTILMLEKTKKIIEHESPKGYRKLKQSYNNAYLENGGEPNKEEVSPAADNSEYPKPSKNLIRATPPKSWG